MREQELVVKVRRPIRESRKKMGVFPGRQVDENFLVLKTIGTRVGGVPLSVGLNFVWRGN